MICTMVILRQQWIDHEKPSYALVQVPMEMVQRKDRGPSGARFSPTR